MYNKTILTGNLTRDIEIRYTPGGSAIGKTGIATNRKFKSQTGEMKDETMFIDLTFFGRTAEIANQYLRKGSKVLVDGRLSLEQWTAQDGSKRSKHVIVVETLQMLNSENTTSPMPEDSTDHDASHAAPRQSAAKNNQRDASQGNTERKPKPEQNYHPNIPEIDVDDEIPF